jgi:hypothetical protein
VPDYCTPKLEFSPDPISDTTPTYTDVTTYLKDADWKAGIQRDLDQPQAGEATFTLRNKNRDWEPEYAGGRFAGNILPMRRFRWSITADGVSRPQGTYYAVSYQVVYPDPGSTESDVVVTCVDGTGLLSLQTAGALDPPSATSMGDVIAVDNPVAYYPLDEQAGGALNAAAGPSGIYKGYMTHTTPNPVLGDSGLAASPADLSSYGRAKLDDENIWHDSGAVSCEGVFYQPGAGGAGIVALGPFDTPAGDFTFALEDGLVWVYTGAATKIQASAAAMGNGHHHVAMTYDGSLLCLYHDGVLVASTGGAGNPPLSPDSGEFLRVAGSNGGSSPGVLFSHVAFYDYALPASRVAAHATAAITRGYAPATAGSRIATLATNALWSTAGIPAGTVTIAPRMQTGQKLFDEIVETTQCEQPLGIFFFNDAGNPDYIAWDDATTIQTILGELEVQYDDVGLVYDDQVFNQATASTETGLTQTASNATSQGQYGVRSQDPGALIVQYDRDALMIVQGIVDHFSTPMYRIESVTMNGAQTNRRTQILTREIGEYIRIKRRGAGGTANPDIVTRIIGKSKHLDVSKNLTCTWALARGFAAATQVWHLSQSSYSELNTATILA